MKLRIATALVVVPVLVLIGMAIAHASIPGPDGVIHGCYKTSHPAEGAVIAIDSAESCPSGYAPLDWAEPGILGYETVLQTYANYEIDQSVPQFGRLAHASCPPGKIAVGGGWGHQHPGDLEVTEANPQLPGVYGPGGSYEARFKNMTGISGSFYVYVWAICATQ